MKLASAHIRHFKSLDDVRIDFSDRVTVLVGPNAVGKSNVVDSLRFVRDAVASELEHAVSARGGIARVRQYSKTKPYKLSIKLGLTPDPAPRTITLPAEYEFDIASLTASNYVVDHEKSIFFEPDHVSGLPAKKEFVRDRAGLIRFNYDDETLKIAPDQLAMGHARAMMVASTWSLERFIRDWRFSSIYPNRLREPSTPDKDSVLAEDGQNWASVIKALRRTVRGRQALDRVTEAIRCMIPTFEEVSVASVGSYLVPNFKFKLQGSDTVSFDPVQLSDGTLRVFGILLALYQMPAPKLLIIEEPEQTVHPGVLGVLAEAFAEASETTQIIVTTHSPHLIDYFQPEQVRVVSMKNGTTKVSELKKTQVEAVKRRLMTMQEFMLAEGLQPEGA